ncbi:hypothetical protein MHIR_DE00040 [Candidatus Doolittlea endobia]|uniref:Uncharacterized protein n=1 Tax=Candidatus Doolittlea endobia TaxID=1778262 RepID=A0A143WRL5_9ENTR|nr:hypothetical protein MHIR_DE00040 [Candidatus Doolittlea endobia]
MIHAIHMKSTFMLPELWYERYKGFIKVVLTLNYTCHQCVRYDTQNDFNAQ